jgi:hypothetical protein
MPGSSGNDHMFPDQETTSYMVAAPTEDWNAWKNSIPRTIPLYERLYTLIQIDTALDGDVDVASLNLLRMKFERIEQRSKTARQALADGDVQKARAELEQIGEVAADMVE